MTDIKLVIEVSFKHLVVKISINKIVFRERCMKTRKCKMDLFFYFTTWKITLENTYACGSRGSAPRARTTCSGSCCLANNPCKSRTKTEASASSSSRTKRGSRLTSSMISKGIITRVSKKKKLTFQDRKVQKRKRV